MANSEFGPAFALASLGASVDAVCGDALGSEEKIRFMRQFASGVRAVT